MLEVTQTVGLKRYVAGAEDAHGNPVESWSAPVDVGVYSIAPTTSEEPYEAGREAVVTGLSILLPTQAIDRLDRIVIDGEEFTIEGDVAVWDNGPFGFEPGMSMQVKKVNG